MEHARAFEPSNQRPAIALEILVIPPARAAEMLVSVLKTAITTATMQAATMMYSNDTTPSLSARRHYKASVVFT
ncbi:MULTISPECIES: hypothetical protein [Bradyrhizobium]|uniref:hypothetical protein n=1 Tax=Bradyrhizobium TaxID=374 RepID=UPI00155A767A|nr:MULTISPECIES: hypothetical protein [Bradyrhizobium]MCP1930618.1 hypothetical protein [Bradyrhizobium elkanii]MCS3517966.1 hypothetical protein [Bradyrhizobium elkanii]MCS3578762.1 hypothetical protein [Bradyrhizobium elkanii]MCS3690622.1 hypothetical protein [Bradyrhizobium elkanii]MCS3721635.1 hypothetical protein [Bradyrhizobium elkanii]